MQSKGDPGRLHVAETAAEILRETGETHATEFFHASQMAVANS